MSQVLILPGWENSGPLHWQSLWEDEHGYLRVEQSDWMHPLRGDWIARLEEVLLDVSRTEKDIKLAAHSLGCIQVAAWAAHSRNTHLVKAALLVAPGDVEREGIRDQLPSWVPVVMKKLPFKSMLLGSRNDPYCSYERAETLAHAWGAAFVDYGAMGHINADSGLGAWPEGHSMLQSL